MKSRHIARRDAESDARLARVESLALATSEAPSADALKSRLGSGRGNERLLGLLLLARQGEAELSSEQAVALVGPHLSDPDLLVRYEAITRVGEAVAGADDALRDEIWQQLCKAVAQVGEESRLDLGCVILEKLLERDFSGTFERIQDEVAGGRRGLVDALEACWLEEGSAESEQVRAFITAAND